ncbi:MAG: HAD family hydrolase [Candidatus Bathyarchaeota archaeon]|nr:MAG: HAD family hydrolase [Candidatus Bathyarchaeota archaeon]
MVQIEVVSFDMEGTLITDTFSDLIWETDIPHLYAIRKDLDFETAKKMVLDEYATVGMEQPEWYDAGYWFRRLDIPGDWRSLLENRREDCEVYPETLQVLKNLSRRYRLIVSSNTIREFLTVQLTKLPQVFDQVFSAPSDFGMVKSEEFYGEICRILRLKPGAIAHIGDSLKFDYEAPDELGINAFHLDRSGGAPGAHVVHDLMEFERRLEELEDIDQGRGSKERNMGSEF